MYTDTTNKSYTSRMAGNFQKLLITLTIRLQLRRCLNTTRLKKNRHSRQIFLRITGERNHNHRPSCVFYFTLRNPIYRHISRLFALKFKTQFDSNITLVILRSSLTFLIRDDLSLVSAMRTKFIRSFFGAAICRQFSQLHET